MCSLGRIFLSKPRWEPKVRLGSLWSLTSQKVRPSCLHLLLFYYIQPPNWHLKPNLEELQEAQIGKRDREMAGKRGKKIDSLGWFIFLCQYWERLSLCLSPGLTTWLRFFFLSVTEWQQWSLIKWFKAEAKKGLHFKTEQKLNYQKTSGGAAHSCFSH